MDKEASDSTGNAKKVPGTGASTPVSVKIKRMEQRMMMKSQEQKQGNMKKKSQIQPTLKSFLDKRSGLLGPEEMPSHEGKGRGNQMAVGRDLPPGPQEGNPKEIGGYRGEKGAGKEEGNRPGNSDSGKERQRLDRNPENTSPGDSRKVTRLAAEGQSGNQRKDTQRNKRKR